jgi:ribosome-binding factor A
MPKHKPQSPNSSGPSQRQLRVGEVVRRVLIEVLARGELRDPALADASITVTEVKISPDLKAATAFVMPLGGRDEATVVAALDRCAPYLRGQIGREAGLRFAPTLRFAADRSFERAQRVERLLDRLKDEPDGAS